MDPYPRQPCFERNTSLEAEPAVAPEEERRSVSCPPVLFRRDSTYQDGVRAWRVPRESATETFGSVLTSTEPGQPTFAPRTPTGSEAGFETSEEPTQPMTQQNTAASQGQAMTVFWTDPIRGRCHQVLHPGHYLVPEHLVPFAIALGARFPVTGAVQARLDAAPHGEGHDGNRGSGTSSDWYLPPPALAMPTYEDAKDFESHWQTQRQSQMTRTDSGSTAFGSLAPSLLTFPPGSASSTPNLQATISPSEPPIMSAPEDDAHTLRRAGPYTINTLQQGKPITVDEKLVEETYAQLIQGEVRLAFGTDCAMSLKDMQGKPVTRMTKEKLGQVVQVILKAGNKVSSMLKERIKWELSGPENHKKLIKAFCDHHANRVMVAYIEVAGAAEVQWLIDSLAPMKEPDVLYLVGEQCGCRVLKSLVAHHGHVEQVQKLGTLWLEQYGNKMLHGECAKYARHTVNDIAQDAMDKRWPNALDLQEPIIDVLGLKFTENNGRVRIHQPENVDLAVKHQWLSDVLRDLILRVMAQNGEEIRQLKGLCSAIVERVMENTEELVLDEYGHYFVARILVENCELFPNEHMQLVDYLSSLPQEGGSITELKERRYGSQGKPNSVLEALKRKNVRPDIFA